MDMYAQWAEQRRNIVTTVTTITPSVMIVMMVTVGLYSYGRRERNVAHTTILPIFAKTARLRP
jgi:hypothetical protein